MNIGSEAEVRKSDEQNAALLFSLIPTGEATKLNYVYHDALLRLGG
jgi:hypothetical protein